MFRWLKNQRCKRAFGFGACLGSWLRARKIDCFSFRPFGLMACTRTLDTSFHIELERVPDLARRPWPWEKLNTQHCPGSIFLKAQWGSILQTLTKCFLCTRLSKFWAQEPNLLELEPDPRPKIKARWNSKGQIFSARSSSTFIFWRNSKHTHNAKPG